MSENVQEFRELFQELSEIEECGVLITLSGKPSSPMQVVSAHMVKEENTTYMRDYIFGESGLVKEICFNNITDEEEDSVPPEQEED